MHRRTIPRWALFGCAATLLAEVPDLLPLMPRPVPATAAVADAVKAGDVQRAAMLVAALADADERRRWLAVLAIVRNDSVTAIRTLRAAPGSDPKVLGVAYYLARQYLLFRGQMAEAIRRDDADFGPYYFLGRHYDSDLDDCAEAVKWLRLAAERNPAYARTRAHLGYCLERLGHPAEAELAYRAALPFPLAMFGMARLASAAGDAKGALSWVNKGLAAGGNDPAGLRLGAKLHEAADQPREAIAMLERAAKIAPHDVPVRYALHRLHRRMGNEAGAKAALAEYERLRAIYGARAE